MFASKITQDLVVQDDDGKDRKVTIRKLSGRSLQNASEARQVSVARMARAMGPEMIEAVRAREAKKEANQVLDPSEARFQLYDRETTLVAGIASWEFEMDVVDGVKDLDEDNAERIFRAIITLSVPTQEERKAVKGKA